MGFWFWAVLILLLVVGLVALLFGLVPLKTPADWRRLPFLLLAAVLLLAMALVAGWMEAAPPQAGAPGAAPLPGGEDMEIRPLIGRLEAALKDRPDDAEGWRMLGWSRFQLADYAGAAAAYQKAAALQPTIAAHASAEGEALAMAAGGTITPDARRAFERARVLDAADVRARYYLALAREQAGDAGGAIADWQALLADAPAEAEWAAELRVMLAEKAAQYGVATDLPGSDLPGPDIATAEAVAALPAGEQQAMIARMVDGLDARLKANPQDLQGWERLIRARLVQGETQKAADAHARAKAAFAGQPDALQRLDAAAAR